MSIKQPDVKRERPWFDCFSSSGEADVVRLCDIGVVAIGFALTIYLTLSTLGFLPAGTLEYYANFALAIAVAASLMAVRDVIQARAISRRLVVSARLVVAICALIVTVGSFLYLRVNVVAITNAAPFFTSSEEIMGFTLIASVIALVYLIWGGLLTGIAIIPILYFFFGHFIKIPLLGTPTYTVAFILNYISLNIQNGFFQFVPVTVDKLYFLVLFGALLFSTGMLTLAHEVGKYVGSKVRGGAAFPAIIGSGTVGMVVGQAVANIGLSGSLTIPLMIKNGFRPSMAAAIETMASTSGQFMPPILGLAGFLIAATLYIPYSVVAERSLIPACLFLGGIVIGVLRYAASAQLPKYIEKTKRDVIARMLPTLVIPFAVVFVILFRYQVADWAGLAGIVSACVLALAQGKYRPRVSDYIGGFKKGFELIVALSVLAIAIGPIAQAFITTNLAGRLVTQVAVLLPHGKLVLLVVGMCLSLVLGMGLPTPIAYLVAAMVMVPFMQQLAHIPAIYAHFFVFYFAVFSTLTPPVAVGVMAASRIAGASFYATARDAMRFAAVTFIIPFAFVYNPSLLNFPHVGSDLVWSIIEVLVVQWVTAVAVFGYLRRRLSAYEEIVAIAGSVAGLGIIIRPDYTTYGIFLGLVAILVACTSMTKREISTA